MKKGCAEIVELPFDPGDVFEEKNPSSGCIRETEERRQEVPFVVPALLLSGDTVRLARDARHESVNHASKRLRWQVFHIAAPNRGWLQGRVFHARFEHGTRFGLPLNMT